jgi:hypothetical protein
MFRLVHPNAPAEQRQVSVAWGESITLEVHMNIPAKVLTKSSASPSAAASAADPGP